LFPISVIIVIVVAPLELSGTQAIGHAIIPIVLDASEKD
jgi:hypothetical protein